MTSRALRLCLAIALFAVFAAGGSQLLAKKPGPPPPPSGCPRGTFCLCADIYCPVTCTGGCKYVNPCVADCAGATGCTIDAGTCGIEVP